LILSRPTDKISKSQGKDMSIKIRLAKTGKKNAPAFRVVATQTRTKRNGEFLAVLGEFNPAMGGKPVIDKSAVEVWIKKGGLLTEPVKQMLEGKYVYKKYNPKAKKEQKEAGGDSKSKEPEIEKEKSKEATEEPQVTESAK